MMTIPGRIECSMAKLDLPQMRTPRKAPQSAPQKNHTQNLNQSYFGFSFTDLPLYNHQKRFPRIYTPANPVGDHLDGNLELTGGSKEERGHARDWLSPFWHEAVVRAV